MKQARYETGEGALVIETRDFGKEGKGFSLTFKKVKKDNVELSPFSILISDNGPIQVENRISANTAKWLMKALQKSLKESGNWEDLW